MSRARSMSILHLFCLTYSVAYNPDININLDGKTFQSNDTRWIQMTCLSNKITIGCTAEFLTNQRSYDHLRGVNNECYHTGGWCAEQLCTCSDDCKQFTLNITTLSEFSNTTFGCTVIVEVDNLKYKATTVIKPVQNGYELFNKEIIPLHVNISVQETTTHSPLEKDSLIERIGLAIAICTGIICTLSIITVVMQIVKFCRRYSKKDTSEGISSISYPKTNLYTENSAGEDRNDAIELESHIGAYSLDAIELGTHIDGEQFGFSKQQSKAVLGEDRFSSVEQESHTDSGISSISNARSRNKTLDEDSGISSISNARSRNKTLDEGQMSSIGEDHQQERETSLRDTPPFSNSYPFMLLDSTSHNTQIASRSSPPETKSLFDRESNRGTWSRYNGYNILLVTDNDD